MSLQTAKAYLEQYDLAKRVIVLEDSSATVELAAQALGCEPARIAKTLSFFVDGRAILIVTAGDVKIDNKKYKEQFQEKAKMIPADLVEQYIGHAPGGVCPFGVKEGTEIYLDVSLQRFATVYPACGSGNSAIELTIEELAACSGMKQWVDICKS